MKKILLFLATAVLGITVLSCGKEGEDITQNNVKAASHAKVLVARLAEETKTFFDGSTFKWNSGDAILVRSDNSSGYTVYNNTTGESSGAATFEAATDDVITYGDESYAVYPDYISDGCPKIEEGILKLCPRNTYTWSEGAVQAPMIAKVVSGEDLKFTHLGGLLKVTYKNVPPKARYIVVTAPIDETHYYKISQTMGPGGIYGWEDGAGFTLDKPYFKAYNNGKTNVYSVKIDINSATSAQRASDEGITAYVPLPVGPVVVSEKNVYPKLKVSLTFADGTTVPGSAKTATNVQIERASIKPMPAIALTKYSIEVAAGTDATSGVADGIGTAAKFQQLRGLIWLDSNTLALTQSNGDRKLRMFNKTTAAVTTSTNVIGASNGAPWQGALNGGLLYVANKANNLINSYNPSTGEVVANVASVSGGPMCIRFHGGDAYVVARDAGKLYKYTGGITGAQNTLFDFSALDVGETIGEKNYPLTLAIDADGNVIVPVSCAKGTSPSAYYVYVIKQDGTVLAKIGKGVKAASVSALVDGASSNATFGAPNGITIDNSGNIILAESDSNGGVVRKIVKTASDYSDAVVMTILGGGSSYKTAIGATAAFNVNIMDVAFDPENSNVFYVADQGRYTLRKVTIE